MLGHFIEHKGKGGWVLVLPLLLAAILFIIADSFSLNDTYIGAIALLTSGIILFLVDNKREKTIVGTIVMQTVTMPRSKGKNTLMWIEMRYWAIMTILAGGIWLFNLLKS